VPAEPTPQLKFDKRPPSLRRHTLKSIPNQINNLHESAGAEKVSPRLQPSNGSGSNRAVVCELVAAKAAAAPDAPAMVSGEQVVTYAELDCRANRLAHYLRSLGVGLEQRVGICSGRSPQMVIAALAVLKAGAGYVPMDPEYPLERLRGMLKDADIPVLITHREMADRIGRGSWKSVDMQEAEGSAAHFPASKPQANISAENLAYIIYTSGSSGEPKGVQITHKNLLSLMSWHQNAFRVTPSDRASQLASVGFDAVVWEVWPHLAAGCSIHFPDEATRLAPEPLRDWLVAQGITVSFVPTPLAEALIALDWPADTALRFMLTGGDALHHYPQPNLPFHLINNYGPTECTVVATSGLVKPNGEAAAPPSIGSPIANCQIYILDEYLRPVAPGAIGELHIAGAGVGRGYLNRPDLETQKFIPNPFASSPGERMYKTGDLGYLLPNGQIAFAGRIDNQIKMRGYRIEPEEIVMRLNQCGGVKASVVVARGENGDTRLTAYVVEERGAKLTHSSLQTQLKKYLPDYMIPASFVRLVALPTPTNGKLDRASLPLPSPENTVGDDLAIGPSTPLEESVLGILSELLGIENLSVNDNFFFLGGHSLLGTQLIARARDRFGVELTLRTVFDAPTASKLAAEIERRLRLEAVNGGRES
jgi:amino acid adenylation domain-containing protein